MQEIKDYKKALENRDKDWLINYIADIKFNRNCENCINYLSANGKYPLECGECSRFYADNWEQK